MGNNLHEPIYNFTNFLELEIHKQIQFNRI